MRDGSQRRKEMGAYIRHERERESDSERERERESDSERERERDVGESTDCFPVDPSTGFEPYAQKQIISANLNVQPFGVYIVQLLPQ